jgi:molecular chaperone GrpE
MVEDQMTPTPETPATERSDSAPAPNSNDTTSEVREVERLRQLLTDTEQKLASVEAELHNFKLRLADMENYRKRLLRNLEEEKKYAVEPLVRDLLTAFDNLERAIEAAKAAGDNGPLAVGVGATAAQILDILRRHGVTRIDCAPGTPFDPNIHQAVAQQPSNTVAAGQVLQILHHGFRLHDRVLRPTAVVVATAPQSPPTDAANSESSSAVTS